MAEKRALIDPGHGLLSGRRQCELLGISRGAWLDFYNNQRPHLSLGGRTPRQVYTG